MAATSDIDDSLSDNLPTFTRSGNTFNSAELVNITILEIRYDLLTFLGLAQSLDIEFLPIRWQPDLDNVGEGGTAEVHGALINIQWSFAFKVPKLVRLMQSEDEETKLFRALITEILVLGHPEVQKHPNIISIEGICFHVIRESQKVWPVLVFEKTRHGDLKSFMETPLGRSLSFQKRLELSFINGGEGIIHGDIKPQNVLISEHASDCYVARVADFGYSTWLANEADRVRMPGSRPWVAPEWHHRGFTTDRVGAMKMDAYSFGALCLWILFYNTEDVESHDFYIDFGSEHLKTDLADRLIIAKSGLNVQERVKLSQLFYWTLALDPINRTATFREILQLLIPNK
ncbi:MAG: hypothetical protein Q9187_003257 [Circinaria calcarea]